MRAQRRGRIINISSVLGFPPQPYMAASTASKHASNPPTPGPDSRPTARSPTPPCTLTRSSGRPSTA
ncbi:SDR family NAD(P)-dependent oxidoreductase [Streptomyces griseoruber]|uniref:SDR family NAD(P)-dependent oxidoreductase n=1 Tax=Streptomyces griseoruber TaxID=1943 RepID=UPI000D14C93A